MDCPPGAPGAVADDEIVIRFVPLESQLQRNGLNEVVLTSLAFKRDELKPANPPDRSSSLPREKTPEADKEMMAKALNKQKAWTDDPVLARALTADIRAMVDDRSRREACLYAYPVPDCPSHAYVRRSSPAFPKEQRADWQAFQLGLASKFRDIRHYSGKPVVLGQTVG